MVRSPSTCPRGLEKQVMRALPNHQGDKVPSGRATSVTEAGRGPRAFSGRYRFGSHEAVCIEFSDEGYKKNCMCILKVFVKTRTA